MTVPRERLVAEIKAANDQKKEILARRDGVYGADRPRIGSYLENIALPGLFGFDMNDYYADPQLAMDVELRKKLFWLDNSLDDSPAELVIGAGSMYYDMTLFGLDISYQPDGVPIFARHALSGDPDLSALKPFDFYDTGEMPMVHKRFSELNRISQELYGGEVVIAFPDFYRGPLDIAIQMRGYDNFVSDCAEDPEYADHLMSYIVSERKRFNDLSAPLREPPAGAPTTFIADDWVNIPFISPALFEKRVLPAYRKIQENEGAVTGFHTCGVLVPIIESLLGIFSAMTVLDVSGWNDAVALDRLVDKSISFQLAFINTFVLCSTPEEHRRKLEEVKKIARGRKLTMSAQAIVNLSGSMEETIFAMNRFIALARDIMSE